MQKTLLVIVAARKKVRIPSDFKVHIVFVRFHNSSIDKGCLVDKVMAVFVICRGGFEYLAIGRIVNDF